MRLPRYWQFALRTRSVAGEVCVLVRVAVRTARGSISLLRDSAAPRILAPPNEVASYTKIEGRVSTRFTNSVRTAARWPRRLGPPSARACNIGVTGLAALILLSACIDAPTAPRMRTAPEPRRALYGPGNPVTIPIKPDTNLVAMPDTAIGLSVPDSSMFIIHVNGAIQLAVRPGFYPIYPARALYGADTSLAGKSAPPTGLVLNGVTYPNYLSVHVKVIGPNNELSLTKDPTQADAARTDTTWALVGESFSVSRMTVGGMMTCGTKYPGELNCHTPSGPQLSYNAASYTLSGNQTISVERLDPHISLAASPQGGGAPRTVIFTPTVPAWDGSIQSGGVSWTWTPDGGTAQGVACYTASPCTKSVSTSGTMTLTVAFNAHAGVPKLTERATVHVDVVNCPTGESTLDHQPIRDSLMALLHDSNANDSVFTNRVEQPAFILRRKSDGALEFHRGGVDPNADNCRTDMLVAYDSSVYELAATVHTHPYNLLDNVTTCAKHPNFHPGLYQPTPSQDDLDQLTKFNDQLVGPGKPQTSPISEYIVDKTSVIPIHSPDDGSENNPFVYTSGGKCPWYP